MNKKILIVTTNISFVKDETYTGVWFSEFAIPYVYFKNKGFDITVASPLGGVSPIDQKSLSGDDPENWNEIKKYLDNTEILTDVDFKDYDALFFPGGHGPMFDLANDVPLGEIVEFFYHENRVIGAVCHGPAGLLQAKLYDGKSILKAKRVTSFTNKEEENTKDKNLIPFLLQTKMVELGAKFVEKEPWSEHVEVDGNLITGQNPQSALLLAEEMVNKLV